MCFVSFAEIRLAIVMLFVSAIFASVSGSSGGGGSDGTV